jgi:hypothetical protein
VERLISRAGPLILGAMLGLGLCAAAEAQGQPQMPQVEPRRDWAVDGRVIVGYDSNIARLGKGAVNRRGLSATDWTVTPTVSGRLVQPLGQQYLFVDGSAGYDFHRRNPQLDRERFQVTAGGGAVVGPCRPMAFVNYAASQSDLADLDLASASNRLQSVGTALGMQCGRAVGPGAMVIAQRTDAKNSATTLTIQDRTQETLSASLLYGAPNLADVALIWTYANTEFPNRVNPGRPVGDGFWTQSIGGRVQRDFGSRLTVGVTGSRVLVKREFSPTGDPLKFNSTTWQADAAYRFGRRILIELDLLREVRPSGRPGKLLDIVEGAEGRIRYRLNPRTSVTIGHAYQQVRSNGDTLGFARDVVTNAYTNGTYGSVEFRTPGRLGFTLDVRHEDRNTNLPIFNYISTRVGLTTAVSF